MRRIAPLPHPCGRAAGATSSGYARSRRPSTTAAPVQPPKGLPKCYLCGWFAADSPPAPPMRSWRWGNVIGLRPKPPPQHHGRTRAAPQGASQFIIRYSKNYNAY